MCDSDKKGQTGEARDESRRSEPPPTEKSSEQTAPLAEPKKLADSWGERVGYGF